MSVGHHCHATGCEVPVAPRLFMCRDHWFSLPFRLRSRILTAYRPGQYDDWEISHEYASAAREAVELVAKKEGREPDTRIYDLLDPGPIK